MIRASRLLAAAYTARALYMTASLALSYRSLRTEADRPEEELSEETPALTVIIPALREQAVMPRSLEHFAALAAEWPTLRVLVVTAAREAAEPPSGRPTTEDVCRNLAHQHNTTLAREVFTVVSYPGQGRRASQLNYAVAALDKLSPPAGDYVAVFDADAVPDARLSSQFARAATDRPAMIQQPMLPAFPGSSRGRRSAVMSGQDLASFRRTLGIEYRRIKVARWCAPGRRPRLLATLARPMVYGVGSGLIVRRDKIEDVGFFQEPHDDLAVGHRLSMAGEPIAVLPSVNIVEPYQSVGAMARAFSSVAFANTATRHDYRFTAAHPTRLSPAEQRLLAARALADGASWALGPVVMGAAATHLAVKRQFKPLVAAALAAGLLEPVVTYRLRGHILDDFRVPGPAGGTWRQPHPAAAVATYMLQPAVTALGPWLLGVRASAARFTGRELRFTKTEHLGEIAR
ncbi:glycosyltransferase family 2 protein [Streptomyces sp. NBC_00654]|uniref:glycosyltransferase n=1 Tax=Streptomyces sp. NBC_00654 TaxID=2975799 RepID=UPI002252D73C|nr:glycosyltransferase family 2 protein [Streptomyces sp. NBC_00654]MCX4971118.1 glycosyltransferase family 2 protein [Streptomyces sp. NBC_00654]